MELSERLADAMRRVGVYQATVAASLGVTAAAVSAWCKGSKQPSTALLPQLAKLLDTDVDYLLGAGPAPQRVIDAEAERTKYAGALEWYFRPEPNDGARNY